mmetsp:Transcript_84404/g.165193  ORF Transcript_84404/g.165193 Transcript_84404/m.165193 type:complete len:141 (+) Transcript_84404:96-518(+)
MNNSNAKVITLASVAVVGVLSGLILYYNRETVSEIIEFAVYDSKKSSALSSLRKIRAASQAFEQELNETERNAQESKKNNKPFDSATKNSICALSTDFDFVLASLDKVEGDSQIKTERKKLVDRFKALASRVDALADLVK